MTFIDEVCKLCKSTNYNPNVVGSAADPNKKPKKYEDKLFSRFPLPKVLIRNVIGRLLSDDVYLMSPAFPSPDHRSTRLATQASILYVVLYFQPSTLSEDEAVMREIVDKVSGLARRASIIPLGVLTPTHSCGAALQRQLDHCAVHGSCG